MPLILYQQNGRLLQCGDRLITNVGNGCSSALIIVYEWPAGQKDLDTCTVFLGGKVGYASGPANDYMSYTGDDTGSGPESARIRVDDARADGFWDVETTVKCWAGWYKPAKGSGGCTVKASYRGRTIGRSVPYVGSQSGSAEGTTLVCTIKITQFGGFSVF